MTMTDRLYSGYFLAFLIFLISSTAAAVPSDFDGDGISDPAVVVVNNKNTLRWNVLLAGEETRVAIGFGELGVHLMAADYIGQNSTQPSYLESNGTWHVMLDEERTFRHGADGATYLGGADINGDGKDDALFHTNTCKAKEKAVLQAIADPFGKPLLYSVEGGKGNLFTTYGDVNGDGSDDFCWLKPNKVRKKKFKGRFTMRCKDVPTGAEVARFKLGRVYGRPLPIKNGLNSPVLFALPRKGGTKTIVKIVNTKGKTIVKKISYNSTGPLLVGNYLGYANQEQIAMSRNASLSVFDLASQTSIVLPAPSGINFDDINIVHFDKALDDCYCTTDRARKNGTCRTRGGGGGQCQVMRPLTDGFGGWLHKPHSDSTGSVVNLFPANENPVDCRYERANGTLFREAYNSGRSNGNRSTWRPVGGGSCSGFPKNTIVSCKISGKRNCWKIPDPCTRYD
jgi:hypothetical protein